MNYFTILELDDQEIYTDKQIKDQYSKLLLKYHPDKQQSGTAIDKIQNIKEAFKNLKTRDLRDEYIQYYANKLKNTLQQGDLVTQRRNDESRETKEYQYHNDSVPDYTDQLSQLQKEYDDKYKNMKRTDIEYVYREPKLENMRNDNIQENLQKNQLQLIDSYFGQQYQIRTIDDFDNKQQYAEYLETNNPYDDSHLQSSYEECFYIQDQQSIEQQMKDKISKTSSKANDGYVIKPKKALDIGTQNRFIKGQELFFRDDQQFYEHMKKSYQEMIDKHIQY